MAQVTHYSKFFDWLFDGNRKSPIPVGEPDILKYNSPITETFVIKMFIRLPKLNHYLNDQYNNMGLRYLDKEDLFKFIKQCVFDFKVKRNDIHYFPYKPTIALTEKLKKKLPLLKGYEVSYLSKVVEASPDKDKVYSALGLEKPKKQKLRKKTKKKKIIKISLEDFLRENFKVVDI